MSFSGVESGVLTLVWREQRDVLIEPPDAAKWYGDSSTEVVFPTWSPIV